MRRGGDASGVGGRAAPPVGPAEGWAVRLSGGTGNDFFVIQASDGVGTDTIVGFEDDLDAVDLVGLTVGSGIGSATVVLSNGSTIVSSGGHLWEADDFV